MSQPILRFIEGIDEQPRELTSSEIAELTSTQNGAGDWFAQYLAATPVDQRGLSFRAVLTKVLPAGSYYETFAVCDGLPIVYDHANPDNPLNRVSRALRFVVIALPDMQNQDLGRAILSRTLCFVASPNPDGTDGSAFLQCASWDPRGYPGGQGITRFYQRNPKRGWVFFGDSFDAVSDLTGFMRYTSSCFTIVQRGCCSSRTIRWVSHRSLDNFSMRLSSGQACRGIADYESRSPYTRAVPSCSIISIPVISGAHPTLDPLVRGG